VSLRWINGSVKEHLTAKGGSSVKLSMCPHEQMQVDTKAYELCKLHYQGDKHK